MKCLDLLTLSMEILGAWDVSKVTNMYYMFQDAKKFNGDLSSWNVSSVRNMEGMFYMVLLFIIIL